MANREVTITEDNIISLVENLILRPGVQDDIVSYGLSSLFKLADKVKDRKRITNLIRSFDNSPSYEVQKRACEYSKLLEPEWSEERKKDICIPIPIMTAAVEMFRPIPVGSTEGALDQLNLALPEKIDTSTRVAESAAREQAQKASTPTPPVPTSKPKVPTPAPVAVTQPQTGGGDIFDMMDGPSPAPVVQPPQPVPVQAVQAPVVKQPAPASSFEDIFFSDTRPTAPAVTPQPVGGLPYGQPQMPIQPQIGGFGGLGGLDFLGGQSVPVAPMNTGFGGLNLLGGTNPAPLQPAVQPVNTGFMGGMNFGINQPPAQVRPPVQNTGGLDLLGGFSLPSNPTPPVNSGLLGFGTPSATTAPTANLGFNLLGPQQSATNPTANFLTGATISGAASSSAFRAYENQHLEINMKCNKESADTASIQAIFSNKTGYLVENLVFQVAVMKHLKLSVNPLNSTSMQPYSRDSVIQQMKVVNTTPGQKGIVMKFKLTYSVNGERIVEEGKISNFPDGY